MDKQPESESSRPELDAPAETGADRPESTSPWVVRRSLLWKQALFVGGLVVLCAGTLSAVGYFVARGILRDQIHQRLVVVAADRRARLEAYATHQRHQVGLVASRTRLRELLKQHLEGTIEEAAFREETRRILDDACASEATYQAIWITDPAGRVISATEASYLDQDFSADEDFQHGRATRHLGLPRSTDGVLNALAAAPAQRGEESLLGVVMVAVDVAPLEELLRDTTGLGHSGRVLVGRQVDSHFRYLLPRGGPSADATPMADLPAMQEALRGKRGFGTSRYCNEEILAAYQPVAYEPNGERSWGVVAMLDAGEAYAPVARLRRWLLLAEGLLLVGGVGIAYVLSRRLTRPILELAGKARALAEGHHEARADIQTDDELGLLANSFNQMADRLAQSYARLEQRVAQRTAALVHTNEELEREVAERKRFEQTLRDTEALYHSLVESLPLNIFRKDLQGRLQFANRRFCETVGRPLGALYGKTDFDMFPRELAEKYRRDDIRVAETGEVLEVIERHRRPDGHLIYVQVLKAPLSDADGRTVGVQGMFWDVTARKEAEAALEQERYLLHALMDHLPHNIYFKDRESRFMRINRAMARYVGLADPREAIGKTDFDFFAEEHARQAREDELEVMRSGRGMIDKEEKETWSDGTVTWVSTTKLPLLDERGNVIGTFGISRDVTEARRSAEALKAAKEAAESANRAKSVFLANVSHEIRTPMNAILGMTELVLASDLSEEQQEFLGVVRESGENLLSVINDILDFSKIEAGKLDLEQLVFDPREMLGDTMRSLAVRAHTLGLELACQIHPEVPGLLLGDRTRLRQIIVNLVGNAIKFTEQGEVVLEVAQESVSDDGVVLQFTVSDTGIGIPEDKRAAIFGMFEQADPTTTRRFGGTGLGLAICARLTDLMGGHIWVESEVGQGSRFHFTAQFQTVSNASEPLKIGEPDAVVGIRVLAVDDNTTNRRILEQILSNWDMRPASASSAADALVLLHHAQEEGDPFRLVLSDVQMPTADGFALAEQIKHSPDLASTVIMMLTSSDQQDEIKRCERLGIASYIRKPVKQSELFDAIMLAIGAADVVEEEPAVQRAAAAVQRPLAILLAEDSLVNQKLALALLKRQGHRVVVANNGKEAAATAATQAFDAILMDVQMPEMDGFEATAAIRLHERQTGRRVPIVAMTAHALKGDRERCLASGMDDYVSKPIRAERLFHALARVTSGQTPPATADLLEPANPTVPNAETPDDETPDDEGPSSQPTAGVVDWEKVLSNLRGDREILQAIVEAGLEESPKLLSDIQQAIEQGDATALRLAAHTLKGSIRYFEADKPFEYAYQLEMMGKNRKLESADTVLAALRDEMTRLITALSEYMRGGDAAEQS